MQAKVSSEQDSLRACLLGKSVALGRNAERSRDSGAVSPRGGRCFQRLSSSRPPMSFTRVTDILLQERSLFITSRLHKSPVGHLKLGII